MGDVNGAARDEVIEREWREALADAEIEARDVRLIVIDRPRPESARLAVWHAPDEFVLPGGELVDEELDRANADGCKEHHRVILWRDFPLTEIGVAIVAGWMRHELEHARQWNALGATIFELDGFLTSVVLEKVGSAGGSGGAAAYYNFKPVEQDANAAASMYLRRRYADRVENVLADQTGSALVRSHTAPEGIDTLWVRSFAFLFQFRRVFETLVAPLTPLGHIEAMYPDYADAWRSLESLAAQGNGAATQAT